MEGNVKNLVSGLIVGGLLAGALAGCGGAAPAASSAAPAPTSPTSVATTAPTKAAAAPTVAAPTSAATTATSATSGAKVTETKVVNFNPTVPAGEAKTGECFAASLADPRPDAWRCSVGNAIYDPCFGKADGSNLVCDADPLTNKAGFAFKPTKPMPTPNKAIPENAAWMLQLEDGTVCGMSTGATAAVDGERLNYSCMTKDGKPGPWLVGDPKVGKVWTARAVTGEVGANGFVVKTSQTVNIATVWR